MKKTLTAVLIILFLAALFFWQILFQKKIAFPGDVLVGIYYPWLSQTWGYQVGVPVKNPMLSDPVSQVFVWKSLVAEAYRQGRLPLWNPYSYSGYPLLANWQSGALYPFNIFQVLLGDIPGWNLLLLWGTVGSLLGMFLFLRHIRCSPGAAVVGSVTYAFSAFTVTWMEFVSGAQTLVWIPFVLLGVELLSSNRRLGRLLIPAAVYCLLTSGQAHITVFALSAAIIYSLVRLPDFRLRVWFSGLLVTGILLAAPQILPTFELSQLSIRLAESYISAYRWGLIPPVQLITGIAPDFFGNPATGNHWGWWQYHETVFYSGVLAVVAVTAGLLDYRRLKHFKFFLWTAVTGLAFGLDWPVGRLPYDSNLPILSTGSAGRAFALFILGSSVLTAWWVDRIKSFDRIRLFKAIFYPALALTLMVMTVWVIREALPVGFPPIPETRAKLLVSLRNSVYPLGLLALLAVVVNFRQKSAFVWLVLAVVVIDLFRAGWKYLPFVDTKMVYPQEAVLTWLRDHTSNQVVRIDRERSEVLPPNTWAMYRLSSPSGYDPLAVKNYTEQYEANLNGNKVSPSRYAELTRFDSLALGRYNVKYLLAVKRDDQDRIPGDKVSYKIDESVWKRVFETDHVAILENPHYQPRARIPVGQVTITDYRPGHLTLPYTNLLPNQLIELADAYYPGWRACELDSCTEIIRSPNGFMHISPRKSAGVVDVVYQPDSFRWGMGLAGIALLAWIGLSLKPHL